MALGVDLYYCGADERVTSAQTFPLHYTLATDGNSQATSGVDWVKTSVQQKDWLAGESCPQSWLFTARLVTD